MTLGQSLKKIRKNAKLTQREVAERLDVDNTTISKWESDVYEPDTENLKKMADLYGKTVDELLGRNIEGNFKLEELKEELKRNNIDIFAHGGFEGFEDLSAEEQQFILQNVRNSIEMFKKMKEQNK